MTTNTGNKFIPSFISSNIVLAATLPYLVVLVRSLGYNSFLVGILMGIFEIAGVAGPFIFGYWADKTGNYRPSLIIACILPALAAYPLLIWVHPAATAVFLFFIAFGFRSLVSLIDAATTIQIGVSGNYGRLRVWGSIAFIIMTTFFQWTPFLKPDNAANISYWIIITSAVSVIPIFFIPRVMLKTFTAQNEEPQLEIETEKQVPQKTISAAFIFCGFAVIFLSRFGMSAIITYFPLYMIEAAEWDAAALMLAIAAISEAPFLFLGKKLIRRFGSMSLMVISAAGVSVRLLILAFLPFHAWIIAASALHSICFGVYFPAAIHFISAVFPVEKRGRGMSLLMIMGTGLPSLLGTIAGGAIIESFGYTPLFVLYAAISGAAVIIYFLLRLNRSLKKGS